MIKTVSLTADTETKVEISGGYNVGVVNFTTDMLYASRKSGVVAGADDVAAIPAGDSYVIRAADDTVYLLATAAGDVQLESIGAKEVFKIAATRPSSGGGGGTDDVARQAISSHAGNAEIHVTAEEREAWNGKTTLAESAEVFSNPNLLINPDFEINQRGQKEYVGAVYGLDGWKGDIKTKVEVLDNGRIRVVALESHSADTTGTGWWALKQILETRPSEVCCISVKVTDVTGHWYTPVATESDTHTALTAGINHKSALLAAGGVGIAMHDVATGDYIELEWIQAEPGTIPTRHVKSNEALELVKCQRYYQVRSTGDIDPVDLCPSMAEITDIKQREDGNYEYVAEL